jgi:hypothetical protein
VESLVKKAEDADSRPLDDGLSIPEEIARREERMAKLAQARAVIEERFEAVHREKQAEPDHVSMPARFYFAFASLLGYERQVGWRRSRGVLAETANATDTASTLKR